MENNPYQPPQAPVADSKGVPLVRPQVVVVALTLLWAAFAVDVLFWVRAFNAMRNGEISTVQWLGQLIGFVIAAFLIVMIGRGRNWARIVFLILTLLGVAFAAYALSRIYYLSINDMMASGVVPAANLVAMFLVFVPGRAWFRPR